MISYKARFNQITKPLIAGVAPEEDLFLSGVALAMDMRNHHAAYRWGQGVGMLTVFRSGGDHIDGMQEFGLTAAVVTNAGTVVAERHTTHIIEGDSPVPCNAFGSNCSAYILPINAEELRALGDFTAHQDDPWSVAAGYYTNLKAAIYGYGHDLPSDVRSIAMTLLVDAGHRFAHPLTENFIGHAVREATKFNI